MSPAIKGNVAFFILAVSLFIHILGSIKRGRAVHLPKMNDPSYIDDLFRQKIPFDPIDLSSYVHISYGVRYVDIAIWSEKLNSTQKISHLIRTIDRFIQKSKHLFCVGTETQSDCYFATLDVAASENNGNAGVGKRRKHYCLRLDCFIIIMLTAPSLPVSCLRLVPCFCI